MPTLTDAEVSFYQSVLGAPSGSSLSDLRYAYFLAALDGSLPAGNFTAIPGYDPQETQTLKNVQGVLTWVTDA